MKKAKNPYSFENEFLITLEIQCDYIIQMGAISENNFLYELSIKQAIACNIVVAA